jgi:apolipoprotein N-acyltransferase
MRSDTNINKTPRPFRAACALAALSGVLLILPFRIESGFPVAWFALTPLLFAIQDQRLINAAVLGWVAGTAAHLIGVYWLVGTMVRFGGIPAPISVVLFILIAALFGLIYVPFTLACRLLPGLCLDATLRGALFIAAAFTVSEFIFPGLFPWRVGYSQAPFLELVQIADMTGSSGITFLAALTGAVIFQWINAYLNRPGRYPWTGTAVLLGLVAVVSGYGVYRLDAVRALIAAADSARVALLQPNVEFDAKFDPVLADRHIGELFAMSAAAAAANPALIIWPETGYRKPLQGDIDRIEVPVTIPASTYLYVGANVFDLYPGGYHAYNSLLALNPDGAVLSRYDKHRLFPFGEYLPFSDMFPALKKISGPISDFQAGAGPPVQVFPNGIIVGPLICYEDIFPDMSRRAVREGARLLVNVTNDAWFGDTAAPHQHLQLALFRSIENRVPMARATNTGVTAIISPTGEITRRADPYTDAIISDVVPLPALETFYTRHGEIFAVLLLVMVSAVIARQILIRYHHGKSSRRT